MNRPGDQASGSTPRLRRSWLGTLTLASLLLVGALLLARHIWDQDHRSADYLASLTRTGSERHAGTPSVVNLPREASMVRLDGGLFSMGSPQGPADAQPRHLVRIDPFWLDEHEVTNAQFAAFVEATGYRTTAELAGASVVFDPQTGQWNHLVGAAWQHPRGPESTVIGRDALPVVQVSWYDAMAYADWAGKRLPTEAEWEFAARGGLHDADYPWGRWELVDDQYQANYWQGRFPLHDEGQDGFVGLAGVGRFSANPYGLYDMAGNVWEWCADWYSADCYWRSEAVNPAGPRSGKQRVARGGSWLSAADTDRGYAVWSRRPLHPSHSDNQTGFRCARNDPPRR